MSRAESNWERLVRSALQRQQRRSQTPGRITSGLASVVPSALNAANIDAILKAADEIQDEDPNVARILCEHAYSLAQNLDPNSEGRGVLQFKRKPAGLLHEARRAHHRGDMWARCGGGFLLALAHDYRFMKGDRSVLYMSELDHGMKLPRSLMAVVRSKLLPAASRDVVLGAGKFSAQTALEGRIVDSVYADSAQTLEAAISEAQKLASRGWKKNIYSELRLGVFPGVVEELDAHRDPYLFPASAKL